MRDPGLEASRVAGGVGTTARKFDTARPSSPDWHSVPTDETDAARVREYALLATLLKHPPDSDLLARLARIRGDGCALGIAHTALAEAAGTTKADQIKREFFELFIGVGRGELLPYGSYYFSGRLNDRPLAALREHLGRLGIERADIEVEPEDHAALLCEIMAGLIGGRFGTPLGADRALFDEHVAPWMGRFFSDLEQAKSAAFYRRVGTVGRVFVTIEAEAFATAN